MRLHRAAATSAHAWFAPLPSVLVPPVDPPQLRRRRTRTAPRAADPERARRRMGADDSSPELVAPALEPALEKVATWFVAGHLSWDRPRSVPDIGPRPQLIGTVR